MFRKSNFSNGDKIRAVLAASALSLFSGNLLAGNVSLAWDASTSAGIGGYKLYYGQASKNYAASVDVGNATSYQLKGLADGSTYYFAVKAYNTARSIESAASNEISAVVSTAAVSPPAGQTFATSFTASNTSGAAPLKVHFVPADSGVLSTWRWEFGTTAIPGTYNKYPTVTYTTPGTYVVTYRAVRKADGAIATATQTITVLASGAAAPVAQAPAAKTTQTTVSQPATAPAANATGLVAAYRFDEIGGGTVVDASGMGNNGVITEAVRGTGRFNNSLKFDGVNDLVTINDSNSLDLTNGMTLEAWVNPTVSPVGWQNVLLKEQPGQQIYSLNVSSSSSNRPAVVPFINGLERPAYGGSQLLAAKWTHLAATYDGQNQRLYVDGVLVATQAQTGSILTSTGALRIGGNKVWGEFFQGQIDEVRVYNRALSGDEIQKDMATAIAVSNPTKAVLGLNQMESFTDKVAAGEALAYRVAPQKASAVTEVNVYLDTAAAELAAGIYSDVNGHPGVLLAQGKISDAKAGATNTVRIPAVTLAAGTQYWIAIIGPKGEISFRERRGTTAVPVERSGVKGLAALPSQWTVGAVAPTDGPISAYGAGY